MRILSCMVSLTLFFIVMSGYLQKDSIRAKEVHLQKDKLALKHLNQAYQKEQIGALAYVQEYNTLHQCIEQEIEILTNGYTSQY